MKLPFMDTLGSVGLVGERKAMALFCLGFYTTLFFMIGLSARTELPEWVPVFSAMTLMYGSRSSASPPNGSGAAGSPPASATGA